MLNFKVITPPSLKTVSIPSLKFSTIDREFALHGGHLYVDGEPVQSYFSRDMFYWEKEDEQGALHLRHHGLMAEVDILREGIKQSYHATAEMHYEINYTNELGDQNMQVYFGICMENNSGTTHYYCGLQYNKEWIIDIPETDQAKQEQQFMSVTVNKDNLLNIIMDTSGCKVAHPQFPVINLNMTFDAAYNTCNVEVKEGIYDVKQFKANSVNNQVVGETVAKGLCQVCYSSDADHKVDIDVDALLDGEKAYYYCGIVYDGETLVKKPETVDAQKSQKIISCTYLLKKWNLSLNKINEINKNSCISGITVSGNNEKNTTIIENRSNVKSYTGSGKIKLTQALKNRNHKFQANKEESARLKTNFLTCFLSDKNLSTTELFSLTPPPSMEVTDSHDSSKKVILDGQAYSHQKSTEILTYLAAYYTADIKSSDKQLSYSDLYGYTKAAAKVKIDSVNKNIIQEIEAERDSDNKEYIIEFLIKYSDIILSSSYASSTNDYIQKGFKGITKPVERCQYYLSDDHENALQREVGYQVAIKIIDKYVYASLVPKLENYMNDDSADWAEELYYEAVEKIMMIKFQCVGDNNKATHICKMLAILDDKKKEIKQYKGGPDLLDSQGNKVEIPYAAALYAQIFDKSLAEIGNSFQGPDDLSNFLRILEIFFGNLYDKIEAGSIADIPEDVLEELNAFLEMDRNTFIEMHIIQLQEMLQFMAAIGDMTTAFAKYAAEVKNFSKLCGCLMYVLVGLSFASIFTNWASLTKAEQAESVMVEIMAALGTVREAMIWRSVNILNSAASAEEKIQAAYRLKFGGNTLERVEQAIPGVSDTLAARLEDASVQYSFKINDPAAAEIKMSAFTKVFIGIELTFQLLNVALLGFAFIMCIINLVHLFKYKYSDALRTVAVINTIVLGISLILGVVSFALSFFALTTLSWVTSVIPVIGGICMFVSFVLSVTEMLLQPDEPKPPIQLIIEEHLAPTVKALAEPTSGWEQKTLAGNQIAVV